MQNDPNDHKQGPHFQPEDYQNIVDYLEIPAHRDTILGSRVKTAVGKKVTSKKTVFTGFAGKISALYNERMQPLHDKSSSQLPFRKMDLSGQQMEQRYNAY